MKYQQRATLAFETNSKYTRTVVLTATLIWTYVADLQSRLLVFSAYWCNKNSTSKWFLYIIYFMNVKYLFLECESKYTLYVSGIRDTTGKIKTDKQQSCKNVDRKCSLSSTSYRTRSENKGKHRLIRYNGVNSRISRTITYICKKKCTVEALTMPLYLMILNNAATKFYALPGYHIPMFYRKPWIANPVHTVKNEFPYRRSIAFAW